MKFSRKNIFHCSIKLGESADNYLQQRLVSFIVEVSSYNTSFFY